MIRKTKIVCTLGPASDSEEMISKLMDAGMNVCRLNMSHGSYEEQGARIDRIKRLRREKNIPVAIMLDTKGPEVRTKTLKADKVTLQAGQEFILTSRDIEGDETQVAITYPRMVELVHPGNRILIDDGLIALDVKQIKGGTDIVCSVVNGGVLGGRKGISVPDVDLQMPSIGEKDRSDIVFGIEKGIDLIAASFVCRPSDVLTLRKLCADNGGSHVQIFSKIENRMGVNNFDEILKVSDGIMVARGDLGVEVDMEEVPVLQKQFIHKCNVAAKPVITATQMLDSMIRNPRPTRAEASDVANAIIDGTDAIMLSGETANTRLRPSARWCASRPISRRIRCTTTPSFSSRRPSATRRFARWPTPYPIPAARWRATSTRTRLSPRATPARRRAWSPASARIARSSPRPRASTHTTSSA